MLQLYAITHQQIQCVEASIYNILLEFDFLRVTFIVFYPSHDLPSGFCPLQIVCSLLQLCSVLIKMIFKSFEGGLAPIDALLQTICN